jgi:hypothetical protein
MLNQMDGDADMEPSLGFTTGGYMPELHKQDGPGFHMNADSGRDLEDEHDGAEPDDDKERWLGWANEGAQNFGPEGIYADCEATTPEWPAEHPKWQPPKRRTVAPPVPTIPMSMCKRVPA